MMREDQRRTVQERVEALLLDGIASGDAETLTQIAWEEIRRQVRAEQEEPGRAAKYLPSASLRTK